MKTSESKQKLVEDSEMEHISPLMLSDPTVKPLGPIEKQYLLQAERGDCAGVQSLIQEYKDNPDDLDINCVDPLNRTALIAAIENENIELIRLLIEEGVEVKDALLHAIKEEYVEAVELLLNHEEETHLPGEPYSWESIDKFAATFTPDITPLILAAHKNNYEIIKILLDRGASLPMPHDIRCGCDECATSISSDSLKHSQARINAYAALSASSLIALSSKDPILTAFELSWELRKLSRLETEFRALYNEMRSNVQTFAVSLLDHVRSSRELEIMLNYDLEGTPWEPGDHQSLERLKLAIKYKQKMFVAHPTVQQLAASIWYEGLPGFRRKGMVGQLFQVAQMGMMFPVYCSIYMMAPTSKMGLFMKKPFVKFICHSTSYALFLMLLGAASQRVEILLLEWFGTEYIQEIVKEWKRKERGAGPGLAECGVILYVISLIWGEIKSLWEGGLLEYISDLWNIVDFITNMFYVMWIALRFASIFVVWREANQGRDPWYPRERWDMFDPMLLSEGAFAAGMIFSFLKLVHIFSVNPHLGPLQISLGRMIIDIVKFFFIYSLVLFAFGCGLNQLLWYYAELEKNKCYHLPSGLPDFDNQDKACTIWRRYSNLFETSQSLFWASFGLVDLVSFELTGIKGFTRFWALLMFGSYSVINVIVLLNMLIAMMSNSYQIISERSDTEWKFARTRLWISYFDDGETLPPPFNLFPTVKNFTKIMSCRTKFSRSFRMKSRERSRDEHDLVMRLLVRRYITAEQRKRDEYGITEDDIMEVRQDVSSLRYELINILRTNGMKTPKVSTDDQHFTGKKGKVMERRLLKDFHIGIVEGIVNEVVSTTKEAKDVFTQIAKVMGKRLSTKKKDWNALVRTKTIIQDPIGTSQEADYVREYRQSLRRHIVANIKQRTSIDHDKLLEYNPKLSEVPPQARLAYAKFMSKKLEQDIKADDEENANISKIAKALPVKLSVKFKGADLKSDRQPTDTQKQVDSETKTNLDRSTEKDSEVIAADDSLKTLDDCEARTSHKSRPLSPIIASPTFSGENEDLLSDPDVASSPYDEKLTDGNGEVRPIETTSPISDVGADYNTVASPPEVPRRASVKSPTPPETNGTDNLINLDGEESTTKDEITEDDKKPTEEDHETEQDVDNKTVEEIKDPESEKPEEQGGDGKETTNETEDTEIEKTDDDKQTDEEAKETTKTEQRDGEEDEQTEKTELDEGAASKGDDEKSAASNSRPTPKSKEPEIISIPTTSVPSGVSKLSGRVRTGWI